MVILAAVSLAATHKRRHGRTAVGCGTALPARAAVKCVRYKVDATLRRNTSARWHPLHVPWLQIGVDAAQTFPQAPQLFGSEFRSVHVPLQQAVPVGQQT